MLNNVNNVTMSNIMHFVFLLIAPKIGVEWTVHYDRHKDRHIEQMIHT